MTEVDRRTPLRRARHQRPRDHHRQRSPHPPHPRGGDRRPGDRGQPRRGPAQRRRDLPGDARGHRPGRAHDRLPHLRLLDGRDRRGVRPPPLRPGQGRASGSGCCSTPGAPTPWTSRCSSAWRTPGRQVRWFRPLRRLRPGQVNHRTHRKVLITDEAVGFTGGVGIADDWQGDARNENEWRDTHFRIEGPAVDGLRAAFLDNWAETDPELFDEVDRPLPRPAPARPSLVQCVRGASEVGLERRGDAVPDPAAAGERADPDHDRVLRARRRAHRPPVRGRGPGRGGRDPAARPPRRQAVRPAGRGGGVRPAARVRRAPLELPAVDAPRQGHDRRPVHRQRRLGQPERPLRRARRGDQRRS